MSKKILAGVLAAASILSISSVASADTTSTTTGDTLTKKFDPASGASYNVSMDVTYGTVSAEIPDAASFGKAYLNPYGATVKTVETVTEVNDQGTSDTSDDTSTVTTTVIAKNNSHVASGVYAIKNLDNQEKLLVIAKTKISKATGVVIKNPETKAPFGWAEVTGKAEGDYDYLTDYDKLTLKDADGKAVKDPGANAAAADIAAAKASITAGKTAGKATGGAVSTKQGKNVGMWLVGGYESTDIGASKTIISEEFGKETGKGYVAFDPKLECSDELMTIDTSSSGYFTIGGQLSQTAIDSIDETKDKVSFTVVFKLIPQPAS